MREIGGNLFYESQEMAALVGVDVQSVRRWVRLGKLKAAETSLSMSRMSKRCWQ